MEGGTLRVRRQATTAAQLIILLTSALSIAVGDISIHQQTPQSNSLVSHSTGPSFDIIMPDFGDLVPGIDPVNLTLELCVRVTDPDGVSMVIGSYKNHSMSEWTNVSMNLHTNTSSPDVYMVRPLNYTMSEPSFVVIWDIKFYANDSLDNWNVSSVHQLSIARSGGFDTTSITTTTATNTTSGTGFYPLYEITLISIITVSSIVILVFTSRTIIYRLKEH